MHTVFDLTLWGFFWLMIFTTQTTIMGVTIYLHRTMAHRALELHPIVSHFFRFWLWLTTGMNTKEWVAIHRKHHAKVEGVEDPHSPVQKGLLNILFFGVKYYRDEARNRETVEKYGSGSPTDWMERTVYTPNPLLGIILLLTVYVVLFGGVGVLLWLINILWIPIHAAGIINGIGHWASSTFAGMKILYQNWQDGDPVPIEFGGREGETFRNVRRSANILPIAFWIGGEELHGNHHAFPTSPKFSRKWYEFDIGWVVIRFLLFIRAARLKSNFR